MKNLISGLFLVLVGFSVVAAETEVEAPAPTLSMALEPYGTLSWQGVDGRTVIGAGLNGVFDINKNFSIVGFGESDNLTGSTFDRFGAGVRYTAAIGKRLTLDSGIAGAWDNDHNLFFVRLPVGSTAYAVREKNFDLGFRLQYAFDISGGTKNGTSTGRLFAGPVCNIRF